MVSRRILPMAVAAYLTAGTALLLPASVLAQAADPEQMGQGLDMLMLQLERALQQDGMAGLDVEALTLSQVIQISNALKSSSPSERKSRIEAALNR